MKVRAYIRVEDDGRARVYIRRDRFKHLFEYGKHKATDSAFRAALQAGEVEWSGMVYDPGKLF